MEGRPKPTKEEKEQVLRKLEPYLKSGLSINKACGEAKLPKSTVFDWIAMDDDFSDRIRVAKQYLSVLTSSAIVAELHEVVRKQQEKKDEDGNPIKQRMTSEDRNFLKWFALNSNLTKEEFGERKDIGLFDPEAEIRRVMGIIERSTTKKTKSQKALSAKKEKKD